MLGTSIYWVQNQQGLTSLGSLPSRLRLRRGARLRRLVDVDVAVEKLDTESRCGLASAVDGELVDAAMDDTLRAEESTRTEIAIGRRAARSGSRHRSKLESTDWADFASACIVYMPDLYKVAINNCH